MQKLLYVKFYIIIIFLVIGEKEVNVQTITIINPKFNLDFEDFVKVL